MSGSAMSAARSKTCWVNSMQIAGAFRWTTGASEFGCFLWVLTWWLISSIISPNVCTMGIFSPHSGHLMYLIWVCSFPFSLVAGLFSGLVFMGGRLVRKWVNRGLSAYNMCVY